MKNLKYCILLLISVSCMGGKPSNTNAENNRLFEHYLSTFEKQSLPFKMDRKAVFDMMNHADSLSVIGDSLKIFVPGKLIKNHPDSQFRSLYVLPEYGNIVLVLIFQELINKYNHREFRNHLVSYNKNGEVVDYQELAGVVIDAWEAYLEISNDYTSKRKFYQRKVNTEKEEIRYACLIEVVFEYSISSIGLINENKKTIREGYFEGDWVGYRFVKPINN